MRRHFRIVVAILVAILIAAIVVACRSKEAHMKPQTDVASVERDIRDHLPIRSSRSEVSAFLDQRKIPHSYVGELKEIPENGHTEQAIIRDVSRKGILKSDIQILFKFDVTDSRLLSYSVREIVTGP
jgi:hypothetical protein